MRKRQTGKRRNSDDWNVNRELSPACRDLVRSLCSRIPPGTAAADYLHSEYLSKFNGEGTCSPAERRSAAIAGWRQRELVNREINSRLRGRDRGYNLLPRITFYRFLSVAQNLVQSVLGPLHDELVIGSFSGGASTSRNRTSSSSAEKFDGQVDVTQDAMEYTGLLTRLCPLYRQYSFPDYLREVPGAKLFTVPKKSTIDRCACKEPDINMYLQKGVGLHIRRRLKRIGINLNDQSINQRLACQGSIDGSLATIDLSSASDSVTRACVQALLPTDWFLYLNDIRSRFVEVDGAYVETEMFSSMGNGFTFELESLIFWALAKTTAYLRGHSGILSVYGDDIIIPSGMYDDFAWVLSEFGFTVNPSKSFHTGSFRESCGGHYDTGIDITPFYLRREPTRLTDVIRVANQLRRWAMTDPARVYEVDGLFQLWNDLAAHVPKAFWGGSDLRVDTQLCSPHPSRARLVRVSKEKEVPEVGRYLDWHTTFWNSTRESIESFPPVTTTHRCRSRSANNGALTSQWHFPEEV